MSVTFAVGEEVAIYHPEEENTEVVHFQRILSAQADEEC